MAFVCCLFIILMVSFLEQILLVFIRSILLKFSFIVLKKYCTISQVCLTSKNHQPVKLSFTLWTFVVLVLKLVHGLFFSYSFFHNWDRIEFYVFCVDILFSQYYMIESPDILFSGIQTVFTYSRFMFSHW